MSQEHYNSSMAGSKSLQTCDVLTDDFKVEPFTIVIFGGAGDLTKRMLLPTLYNLYRDGRLPKDFSVVGLGLPELSDEAYRHFARTAIDQFTSKSVAEKDWKAFSQHLLYLSADFSDVDGYKTLHTLLGDICVATSRKKKEVIFYLAVPPTSAPTIIEKLGQHKLCTGTFDPKIVMEKPFGRDRTSAAELNRTILSVFDEKQVYRIDHYLGKETVQNIMFFRFANSIFEPLWDRRYIDHVQITVAEQVGVEHRGLFYEQTGVVRDIVQNHIMQLVALVAMEPPVGFEADLIRDEKVKVFRTIRPMDGDYIDRFTVYGQYGAGKIDKADVRGYREEADIPPESNTPTFFAAKLYFDTWRWADVPFYIRTGKRLAKRVTEISVQFKQPPLKLLGSTCDVLEPNRLVLGVQPQQAISLDLSVKNPGVGNQPRTVTMDFNYETSFQVGHHHAYERLLIDCFRGDLTLFARQDGVEAMWSIVDPIIQQWEAATNPDFPNYAAGSWGPHEANELLAKEGRTWRMW